MALSEKAMLARLSISQWYSRTTDRKVTDEVAARYQLEEREDRYVKALLPAAALRSVNAAIRDLRVFHNLNTLPWQDGSVRILSAANYFKYQQGMAQRVALFDTEVEHFVASYPQWLEHARRAMKGLFDEAQYPTQSGLRQLYRVETVILPFPDVQDFRVDVGDSELKAIKAAAQHALADSMQQATKELLARIYERGYLLYAALNEPDKVFRDSTVGLLIDTVDIAERLNVAGDAKVELTVAAIRQALQDVTPERLRVNSELRQRTSRTLADILNALKE